MMVASTLPRRLVLFFCGCFIAGSCQAQELAPRAYLITPIHTNAVNVTYSFFDGLIDIPGVLPKTSGMATINLSTVAFTHSLNFFGRTANFNAVLPYAVGNFNGTVLRLEKSAYRSGLQPVSFRFSVNLIGGPAMDVEEFKHWRQKNILGISIRVVPLTGQYDPKRFINYGNNRWAFKPELGYSRRWNHWILEVFGGAWVYTTNHQFDSHNSYSPGTNTLAQNPVGVFEGHLDYDFKPGLWVSLDSNFWFGGSTSLNGVPSPGTLQRSSRIGGTVAIPLTRHQSIKFSYSRGAHIRYSGDFQQVSAGWQYFWLGRPN